MYSITAADADCVGDKCTDDDAMNLLVVNATAYSTEDGEVHSKGLVGSKAHTAFEPAEKRSGV